MNKLYDQIGLNETEILDPEIFPRLSYIQNFVKKNGVFSFIISLGSGITEDANGLTPKNISRMNLLAAVILKALGLAEDIMVVGGPTLDEDKDPESEVITRYGNNLLRRDINALTEENSLTTKENAQNALEYLLHDEERPIAIMGSQFHIPRAKLAFRKVFRKKNRDLNEGFESNWIIEEFLDLVNEFYKLKRYGFNFNPELIDALQSKEAQDEMKNTLLNFDTLPGFGDGGKWFQMIAHLAYILPFGEKFLEHQGRKRGKHKPQES